MSEINEVVDEIFQVENKLFKLTNMLMDVYDLRNMPWFIFENLLIYGLNETITETDIRNGSEIYSDKFIPPITVKTVDDITIVYDKEYYKYFLSENKHKKEGVEELGRLFREFWPKSC